MTIPSAERQEAFLRTMPNAIVATLHPDGRPQITPIWYLWIDGVFWLSAAAGTIKIRNLRRDDRVALCIDDPVSGDYVQVSGTATLLEGDDAREPALALCRKYMPEEQVVPHWESLVAVSEQVIIVVHPRRFQWHDH